MTISLDDAATQYFTSASPENKQALVDSAKGLIFHFANIYGGGCRFDDLIQTGMEGLMKAINNFDPAVGASFATYASHCVIGEIRHFVRKEASFYTPGCIVGLQGKVNQFIDNHMKENGAVPSTALIADKLSVREESVAQIMSAGLVHFDDIEKESIRSSRYQSFQLPIEDKLFLEHALKKLTDLQKRVLYLLFYRDLTQSEVAAYLGISQRQVSRIKDKSIEALRIDAEAEMSVETK